MTQCHFTDRLLLQPSHSYKPEPGTFLEETGTIENFSSVHTLEEESSPPLSSLDTTTLPRESSSLAPSLDDATSPLAIDNSAFSIPPKCQRDPP